jgi:hypothetical protein
MHEIGLLYILYLCTDCWKIVTNRKKNCLFLSHMGLTYVDINNRSIIFNLFQGEVKV